MLAAMQRVLEAHLAEVGAESGTVEIDSESRAMLQKLGYLE